MTKEKRNDYFSNLKQEKGKQNRQEHKLTFGKMQVELLLRYPKTENKIFKDLLPKYKKITKSFFVSKEQALAIRSMWTWLGYCKKCLHY